MSTSARPRAPPMVLPTTLPRVLRVLRATAPLPRTLGPLSIPREGKTILLPTTPTCDPSTPGDARPHGHSSWGCDGPPPGMCLVPCARREAHH